MTSLRDTEARFQRLLATSAAARYAAAAALVFVTIGARAALDPIFRPGVYYHLYYPAVILSAYLFGVRVGSFAAVLAATAAYWLIAPPALQIKTDPQAYLPLGTFMVSALVAVYILGHVRGRLNFLTQEYRRVDSLTQGQADIFREHAERVSNHLQLVSALLQNQAREEPAPIISRVLMNAASRTMLISRMHRSFTKRTEDVLNFNEFAIRLVDSALVAKGRPPLAVLVEGDRLMLPPEQATSLGLVLLECINARASLQTPGVMRVVLSWSGPDRILQVIEEGFERIQNRARDTHLIAAIAEQMRGNLVISLDDNSERLWLSFPATLQPLPAFAPLQPLH